MKKTLQNTTLELIVDKGLKFTISDLAAKQGVSKRTIYEHFQSKQHIIETIVDDAIQEVKEQELSIIHRADWTNAQKLKAILSIVPSGLSFGDVKLLNQMKKFAPNEWLKIERLLHEEWENVQQIIERGIQEGEFRLLHVPSVIQVLRGASVAIYDPDYLLNSSMPLKEVLATMIDVVMEGMVTKHDE